MVNVTIYIYIAYMDPMGYVYHHGDPNRQNIWDPPARARKYMGISTT